MKGTQIKSTLTALFLLLVLPLGLYADSLTEKLEQIKSINNIRPLKSSKFKEKYLVNFNHPVDYKDSSAGRFNQRVVISHTGYDRPTVIVTEGYGGSYAQNENYTEELAEILQANLIHVEYRSCHHLYRHHC